MVALEGSYAKYPISPSTAIMEPILITFKPGKVIALPEINPLSLPKAIKLPVKVSAPIKILSPMVTRPVLSKLEISAVRENSPQATKAEAPPPKPLKMATISGMAVIATFLAAMAPIKLPITKPAIINSKETIC